MKKGTNTEHDVVIIGASFAGLATAYFIKEGRKLILEKQEELGKVQRSTCGTSAAWVEKLGCGNSILATFDHVTMHSSSGHRVKAQLPETFCTVDYKEFCSSLASGLKDTKISTGEKVLEVRGEGPSEVITTNDKYFANILVDCSGWSAISQADGGHVGLVERMAQGMEAETGFDDDYDSFHIYYGKRFIPHGYGWAFPIGGGKARVGVGSFHGNETAAFFKGFIETLGLQVNGLKPHGGPLPLFGLKQPQDNGVFYVGDSLWQVLPLSGEGIRKTFQYAETCGKLITEVQKGDLRKKEALERYNGEVFKARTFYDNMYFLQKLAIRTPDFVRNIIIKALSRSDGARLKGFLELYLNDGITHSRSTITKAMFKAVVAGLI
ncbi:MAG: NAD(P)/FAD-dependent oxidoreductase [Candidatus Hydrothermarchaeales archaeon]